MTLFGNIYKHELLVKLIFQGLVEGSKNINHPKRSWMVDILEWYTCPMHARTPK